VNDIKHFNVVDSTIHLLHRAGQRAEDMFSRGLEGQVMTIRQFIVLSIVAGEENLSQNSICDRTGIDRSTMADIVKRLVLRGWLVRRRSRRDARMYAIRLSDTGRAELERATPIAQHVENGLLSALTARQRADLASGLKAVVSLEPANGVAA
jgi:DNA-binding MarR family transcriptional regulator